MSIVLKQDAGVMIREIRKSRNMSRKELANIAGISIMPIQKIENTHQPISATTISLLARALNMPVSRFVANYNPEDLGTRVLFARGSLGLKQDHLAKMAGVGRGSIYKIEKGVHVSDNVKKAIVETIIMLEKERI